ncbi:hypothetical protein NPIL_600241 [Nephila pilipes]|uniref:Uncharacterized protein n=1 Tax=Nephila pilipes TaxID=299642 RepID=A0A8X6PT98_NEPPI|nr:hypothetical protein NPIL_600241 [Nephila pilipes]
MILDSIERSFFVDEESDEESNAADKNQVQQTNNVQEVRNIPQKTNAADLNDEKQIDVPIKDPEIKKCKLFN